MKYYVSCGGTGAGDFIANTLGEAKRLSDGGRHSYTQMDIYIFEIEDGETEPKEDSKPCCVRKWRGVRFDSEVSDDTNPIDFGDCGYYGDWEMK